MDELEYYGYLARTVPPQRLAQVVALRLWRSARRPFNRALSPPAQVSILRAFGVKRSSELPVLLERSAGAPFAFRSPAGAARAAAILSSELPRERELLLERAFAIRGGFVEVFGSRRPYPRREGRVPLATADHAPIDWERDPLTGEPHGEGRRLDPKPAWAMGRLDEAVQLAAASLLADGADARALGDAALDLCLDLASARAGVQWSCAMEVALRAANLAMTLRLLAGGEALRSRPVALLEVLRSIAWHLAWVEAHPEDQVAVPNNHLVANHVGPLVVAALLPMLPGAAQAGRRAAVALRRELFAQTLPDGLSFEGSIPYHRLAVELFTLAQLGAEAVGAPFDPDARRRVASMFEASADLLDGRGLAPQIGDNDSGRALPFRPRGPQEQGYLAALGTALGVDELPFDRPAAESIWLLGDRALGRPRARRRSRGDVAFSNAGVYLLRSSRISVAISCGPNGTGGTGSHGHNDKLSVEVCVDGRLAIGDPGSGCYTADPVLRDRFRSTASHSTLVVDGQEQQPIPEGRLFALPDVAKAHCLAFESTKAQARFVGEHEGYTRLAGAPVHRREIRLDRRREALAIRDELRGFGRHLAEARFLLPSVEARLRSASAEERERLTEVVPEVDWFGAHVAEIGEADRPLAILAAATSLPPTLEPALYARGYGEIEDALSVCFPLAGQVPMLFHAVLLPACTAPSGEGEGGGSHGPA